MVKNVIDEINQMKTELKRCFFVSHALEKVVGEHLKHTTYE